MLKFRHHVIDIRDPVLFLLDIQLIDTDLVHEILVLIPNILVHVFQYLSVLRPVVPAPHGLFLPLRLSIVLLMDVLDGRFQVGLSPVDLLEGVHPHEVRVLLSNHVPVDR